MGKDCTAAFRLLLWRCNHEIRRNFIRRWNAFAACKRSINNLVITVYLISNQT